MKKTLQQLRDQSQTDAHREQLEAIRPLAEMFIHDCHTAAMRGMSSHSTFTKDANTAYWLTAYLHIHTDLDATYFSESHNNSIPTGHSVTATWW